ARVTPWGLEVLSLPPSFVLSHDQTLMFSPDGPRHSHDGHHRSRSAPAQEQTHLRASQRSLRAQSPTFQSALAPFRANVGDPRRRPRIPSLFPTMSINNQHPPQRGGGL